MNEKRAPIVRVIFQDDKEAGEVLIRILLDECSEGAMLLGGSDIALSATELANALSCERLQYNGLAKAIRWDLYHMFPEYSEAPDYEMTAGFMNHYRQKYKLEKLSQLVNMERLSPGYHCLCCSTPVVLSPTQWSNEEWSTILKVFGLEQYDVEYLQLNTIDAGVCIAERKRG